ncbi:MAG TPA: cysteine--tRNA ligase [Mycobacteriales bacterium]|nr:cysteine--tRNA ligase [Mycobacteriales bacterium]
MTLRLYDTRTRAVRALTPLHEGRVGVYVCGPTVQAAPHVGHLRSAVALDVLHRWLREKGLAVTWVRNVTDVDDKIIHDAAHADEPWWALATRQERAFERAYDAVQVLPPTATPRVTGSVPSIVALIETIISKGAAYESDGDVYLSVRTVPEYGALSGQDPDALRATEKAVGHGHSGAKRDPLDFALWKAGKPGEPSWPSPWGPGRPGWHIECSAMAVDHLGEEFDLHAGGLDLVFPHHENEVAQSVSAGHPFARHWLHHGLVTVAGGSGEKMSKSLGNSTTVEDVLRTVRPQVLRYVLGAAHYRSALEWSPQAVADGAAAYERVETFVRNAGAAVGDLADTDAGSHDDAPSPVWDDFAAALDDDLAVPQALAVLHATVRLGNGLLAEGDRPALAAALADVRRMLRVLGLDPVAQWPPAAADLTPVVDALVGIAVEARAEARARKDWAAADAVRDRLAAVGVVLEDIPTGVRWRLDPGGTA